MYGVRQTKTSPLSIISFKEMFLILKAKSALNPDYDSVPLKLLLCEDHEVFGIELDEVSEYNKNKKSNKNKKRGKARRRALRKRELRRRQASSR